MTLRRITLAYGYILLLLGVAGIFPALRTPLPRSAPALSINLGAGLLFGSFPTNYLLALIYFICGCIGVASSSSGRSSRNFIRIVGLGLAIAGMLGLPPWLSTFGGTLPLFGWNTWKHLVLALPAIITGFVWHEQDLSAETRNARPI